MEVFKRLQGVVAPLDRANVDTDQIIPKQFLKSIDRKGFGDNLFDSWRYLDEGRPGSNPNDRSLNPDFVLNQPRYQDACILLTRENFGCGSSREHAVWALREYGFRCIIAVSFADIFRNNCNKNGVLPIELPRDLVDSLFQLVDRASEYYELQVDLEQQVIVCLDGNRLPFQVDASHRRRLLEGLDDIDLTLQQAALIRAYEQRRLQEAPWLFRDLGASSVPAGDDVL